MASQGDSFDSEMPFYWEAVIFIAAMASILAVVMEFTWHLSEEFEYLLRTVDFFALCLFAIDIFWKYRIYHHHAKSIFFFVRKCWLDIIAVIPLIRILKVGRLAQLSKAGKIVKVTKGSEVFKASRAIEASGKAAEVGSKAVESVGKVEKGIVGLAHSHQIAKITEVSGRVGDVGGRVVESLEKVEKGISGLAHGSHAAQATKVAEVSGKVAEIGGKGVEVGGKTAEAGSKVVESFEKAHKGVSEVAHGRHLRDAAEHMKHARHSGKKH
ncbi:MAG: ion transporter [Candidatus Altiarchaeota archaeon]